MPSSRSCDPCSCPQGCPETAERILVLGASGFVGRHVLDVAAARTAEVTAVGRHDRRGDRSGRWMTGDLAEASFARSLVGEVRPDVIINCAGVTSGSVEAMEQGNVTVVRNVLDAMREASAPPRLVHLGSAVEYGAVERRMPMDESSPARPTGRYGESKAAATALVLGAPFADRMTVLRLFNVVGGGAPRSSLLGSAIVKIRAAQAGDAGEIRLGDLSSHRDFVHVADVAEAIVAAASATHIGGLVLNVGSGVATRSRDLIRLLASVAGFAGEIVEVASAGPHGGHVPWQQADISRAAALLDWRPAHTLQDAVRDAWEASAAG